MPLDHLDPPGRLDDLSPEGIGLWTNTVSDLMQGSIKGRPDLFENDSPRAQFFDPIKTDIGKDAKEKQIFWFAFPRTIKTRPGLTQRQRWKMADDDRGLQDEYCEWVVQRNQQKKIVRVTFTSETPDYYQALAESKNKADQEHLLALYHDFASPEVKLEELFEGERYNPSNQWNSGTDLGPVHLVEGSNNLGAAVELAAAATIPRKIDGHFKTDEQDLIGCSDYGIASRNSDPHIGAQINELARADADVTLANPPGLYIAMLSTAGWTTPDGTDAKSFWHPGRGEKGHRQRAVYEVPEDKDYVVGDIKIGGQPIDFGGQIAEFVSISITGLACNFGQSAGQPFTECRKERGA